MNLIDLAALAILASTVALGAWAGLFPQLLGLVGAAAGFVVALLAAGWLHAPLAQVDQPMRAFLAGAGLVGLTLIGEAAGSAVGSRLPKAAFILAITSGATDSCNSCTIGSEGVSHGGLPTCVARRGLDMFALMYTLRLTMSAISVSLISTSRTRCTRPSMPAATRPTASS